MADNIWFDCQGYDSADVPDRGIIVITLSVSSGSTLSNFITATPIVITLSLSTDTHYVAPVVINATPILITFTIRGEAYVELSKSNWVKWSDIGNLDFTIGRSNVAGEMPMPWNGWVYDVRKLGGKVVVYGENGIALLTPIGEPAPAFGLKLLSNVGLKGRDCVCGTEDFHFFIDRSDMLQKLTPQGGMQRLDYSEFLSLMSASTIMHYDTLEELLYICDGTYGYVYSEDGLGRGPATLTGLGRRGSVLYVTASHPHTITEPLQITTDALDFGVRTEKTVYWIDVGTDQDIVDNLQVKLFYRREKDLDWSETDWVTCHKDGRTPFRVTGVEFKISIRAQVYEYFEIDYVNVLGKTPDMKEVRA